MKKQIAVLGSTGSIGTQALEVIEEQSDLFEVYALTANNSDELLIQHLIPTRQMQASQSGRHGDVMVTRPHVSPGPAQMFQ